MRPGLVKLSLLMMLVFALGKARAQTCEGTLGDPVIKEDFGSGFGAGPALPSEETNMYYTSSNCPEDGNYTILSYGGSNCHSTWQQVVHDHTGNTNGYMMLINASYTASTFFTKHAAGLCPNTTYEFSSYIMNLLTQQSSDINTIQPNITFRVETTSGTLLKQYDTGTILPTNTPIWSKYSLLFTTTTETEVVVKMINNAPGGNGNDLMLDDIAFRACGPLVQTGFAAIADNAPKTICQGDNAAYNLVASVGTGYTNPKLQWQEDKGDGAGFIDMPGKTTTDIAVTITHATSGVHQYRLGVAEGVNVGSLTCRVYSDPLVINVNDPPFVPAIDPQTVCEGETIKIDASGGTTYTWSGPGVTAANKNDTPPLVIDNAKLSDAGRYSVMVTSASGCSNTASTTVTVIPRLTVKVPDVVNVCKGESATIQVLTSATATYSWSPATGLSSTTSASVVANPAENTVYTVTVTGANNCAVVKTVTVNVLSEPVANAGPDQKIIDGQSVKLEATATDADTFYWTPTTGLDDPLSLTPTASPSDDITYTLHASSSANCGTATSTVFVKVFKKIVIPNTFSPNGDGKNDFWDIQALSSYTKCVVNVYNRYGTQVFNSVGYAVPFKGIYNGNPLPEGTYYYIIDPKDGTPVLSGWVLIVH